jgi:hypothetical protein
MRTSQQPGRNQPQPGKGQHASSWRAGEQPDRPARVRQASATSATLTPAERASLRAVTAVYRSSSPSRAALRAPGTSRANPGHHSGQNGPGRPGYSRTSAGQPALRRTTGIVLTAAGAILWLAVHATVAFVATQRAGFVLLITGLLWLWLPVPDKRDLLRRRFDQLMSFLEWDPASAQGTRCSLEDLLEPRSESATDSPRQ